MNESVCYKNIFIEVNMTNCQEQPRGAVETSLLNCPQALWVFQLNTTKKNNKNAMIVQECV